MAEHRETGKERQERIQREQHRPEQEAGYDEAVAQGGPTLPDDTSQVSFLPPEAPGTGARSKDDPDDREADAAAMDVRRREHSAD